MNEKGKNSGTVIPQAELPGAPCWVQCRGYRCLAVLKNGRWKCYSTGVELPDFIEVISTLSADWL